MNHREVCIAVVGSWDPIVPAHVDLFTRLRRYAKAKSASSLVIVLHPAPGRLFENPTTWVEYDDLHARLEIIRACGIDATLVIHFRRCDIDAGAQEFFDLVGAHVRLRELWLGRQQSLGRGRAGTFETIAALASRRSLRIRRIRFSKRLLVGRKTRSLLQRGRVRAAAAMVGRPPVWRRPASGVLRLHWPAGVYRVVGIDSATADRDHRPTLKVRLKRDSRGVSLRWPFARAKWIAFLAGPADQRKPAHANG